MESFQNVVSLTAFLGMWPFRFVLIKDCGRLGVWHVTFSPLRFVALLDCGLWFWFWIINRQSSKEYRADGGIVDCEM